MSFKKHLRLSFPFILLFFVLIILKAEAQQSKPWPYPVPCRIKDTINNDLMIMTLGNVETPLAQGIFDPVKDEVTLTDGKTISNYYKQTLGIKYYKPIDKSIFKLPPSGWCSWYYYYQEINEDEVKQNAKWVADNLKDFGANLIQLDDGWQGVGHGNATNRDWNTIDKRFPGGMASLASFIKSQGMTAGLWIAPHGQSDSVFVKKNPKVFLLRRDGTSASDTWEGRFLIDPSTREADLYMKNLFTRLSGWGYDYFKIDGQPVVVREFRNKKEFMRKPQEDTDALYRRTLTNIKEAIGPEKYLLGCWVVPLEGIGIMDGSRTGGDVLLDWRGFMTALRATMQYYYLHNVVWYADPDVMLTRAPLSIDQVKAWATLQGLTGQALMSSDRMMDLSPERVEIMKRVYPAVDIRPLDLFPVQINKHIWDLKVNHLNRKYDVISLFNYDKENRQSLSINWKDLGITADRLHVFDFWNKEYLGAWESGISLVLNPASCRVLTLLPDNGQIQLISTNRHITQGWVDLTSLQFNAATLSYNGKSKLVKNDLYELRFVFPRGRNFRVKNFSANVKGEELPHTPFQIQNHDGWATVTMQSPENVESDWQVSFEETTFYHTPVQHPDNVWIEPVGLNEANIRWNPRSQTVIGYKVFLNGKDMGFTTECNFHLNNLDISASYQVEVQTMWHDGTGSEEKTTHEFSLKKLLPGEAYLSGLKPLRTGGGWRQYGIDKTVSGKGLVLDDKRYEKGLGIPVNSEMEYALQKQFTTFHALVGVDEEYGKDGHVEFIVLGDGKELWRSGLVTKQDKAKEVNLNIQQVDKLVLQVKGGPKGVSGDEADWVNVRVVF